ncbi:MAG: hypothetical protein CLLPBCKN_002275 [Chroococcidiopsis cubana SAG 39.79]|nr:hypothetical protein [Chroococcidiopsis cubana SAG 39.79]
MLQQFIYATNSNEIVPKSQVRIGLDEAIAISTVTSSLYAIQHHSHGNRYSFTN